MYAIVGFKNERDNTVKMSIPLMLKFKVLKYYVTEVTVFQK